MVPSTCPRVRRGRPAGRSRSASRPVAGAGTSNVAPGISTSATRSPSYTRSPGRTYHRLSTAAARPRSGNVIGTRGSSRSAPSRRRGSSTARTARPRPAGSPAAGACAASSSNSAGGTNRATGMCFERRGEVLAERQHVAADRPQVGQHVEQLVDRLADAEHQPALGDHARGPVASRGRAGRGCGGSRPGRGPLGTAAAPSRCCG